VTRVFIATASPIVRAGLEALLRSQTGIAVVESAADADVVFTETVPDEEPPAGGAPLVVFTDDPRPEWIRDALRSGVRAVLPRQAGEAEILAAVAAAAEGLVVLEPQMVEPMLNAPAAVHRGAPDAGTEPLTPREIEVLRMLAEGDGNKAIAWKLGISEHTVKFHVASIMSKLHAGSRTEAVATGIRQGLILL
jgi:NarL family two-component system response regulator YdfI